MIKKIMPFMAGSLIVFGILRLFTGDYGYAQIDFGVAGAVIWTLTKEK